MSICWFCHWGWPKAIHDIYVRALVDLDGDSAILAFTGGAHIVWEDENFDRGSIQWCIDNGVPDSSDTPEEKAIVLRSLQELLALPDDVLDCVPDNYDGEHPENYPPPASLEMWSK